MYCCCFVVSKKRSNSHGFKIKIPSVTLANYGTTVMGNYGKIMKLQKVITIRLHLYYSCLPNTNPWVIIRTGVGTPTLVFSSSPRFSLFPSLVYYPALGFHFCPPLVIIQPLVFHFYPPLAKIFKFFQPCL